MKQRESGEARSFIADYRHPSFLGRRSHLPSLSRPSSSSFAREKGGESASLHVQERASSSASAASLFLRSPPPFPPRAFLVTNQAHLATFRVVAMIAHRIVNNVQVSRGSEHLSRLYARARDLQMDSSGQEIPPLNCQGATLDAMHRCFAFKRFRSSNRDPTSRGPSLNRRIHKSKTVELPLVAAGILSASTATRTPRFRRVVSTISFQEYRVVLVV